MHQNTEINCVREYFCSHTCGITIKIVNIICPLMAILRCDKRLLALSRPNCVNVCVRCVYSFDIYRLLHIEDAHQKAMTRDRVTNRPKKVKLPHTLSSVDLYALDHGWGKGQVVSLRMPSLVNGVILLVFIFAKKIYP